MTENKKLPELRFDETTGDWFMCESPEAREDLCKDGKPHDFFAWQDFEDGRGGTTVCSKCGMSALEHTLRYGP